MFGNQSINQWVTQQEINYYDNLIIVSVIFQLFLNPKWLTFPCSSLCNMGVSSFLSVFYHCKLNIFGFRSGGQTKQDIWRHHFELWETVMGILFSVLLFAVLLMEKITIRLAGDDSYSLRSDSFLWMEASMGRQFCECQHASNTPALHTHAHTFNMHYFSLTDMWAVHGHAGPWLLKTLHKYTI